MGVSFLELIALSCVLVGTPKGTFWEGPNLFHDTPKSAKHLGVDSLSILFNHRSFPKPASVACFPLFLVAAPLKWSKPKKRMGPFFSRVTEQLSSGFQPELIVFWKASDPWKCPLKNHDTGPHLNDRGGKVQVLATMCPPNRATHGGIPVF